MRREDIEFFLNKKVKLNLKNSYNYTGIIKEIREETILLKDKFEQIQCINIIDIVSIGEVIE